MLQTGSGRVALDPACHLDGRYSRARRDALRRLPGRNEPYNPRTKARMNARALLLCTAMLLTACGSSNDDRTATAITTPQALPSAPVAPHGAASEAARAAGAESRKVIVPKIRDVRASGATSARATAAAKAAGAEPRGVNTPKTSGVPASGAMAAASPSVRDVPAGGVMAAPGPSVRDVPASGVTSASGDALPPGVPYASDTDPVRIVSYVLSSTVIHPGDDITGDVVTSSNVASVTARVGTFTVAVPKVAQGKFHLQMKMPSMPLPPGPTKLIITAIRTDGKSISRDVAITVEL
jgi:hypothetical protein